MRAGREISRRRPFVCVNLLFTLSSPLNRAEEKIDSEGGVISFGSCIMGAIGYECMRRVFNVFIVFEVEGRVKVEPPR